MQYARDCSRLLEYLDGMDKPVVAALNGMALGGGLELAMRCHGLVATQSTWMQFPEITLGLRAGHRRHGGALPSLAACRADVPRHAAGGAEAECLQPPVSSASSMRSSMTSRTCCPPRCVSSTGWRAAGAEFLASPVEIDAATPVAGLVSGTPLSRGVITIIERAVRDAAKAPTLASALEIGYRAFGECACTAAAREGVTAFGERRSPDFSMTG